MPKMKTHSSLKNRIKVTGTGKVIRYKAKRNHMLENKTMSVKRKMRKQAVMASGDVQRIKQMIGSIR